MTTFARQSALMQKARAEVMFWKGQLDKRERQIAAVYRALGQTATKHAQERA